MAAKKLTVTKHLRKVNNEEYTSSYSANVERTIETTRIEMLELYRV
jgi:hypothetical protein